MQLYHIKKQEATSRNLQQTCKHPFLFLFLCTRHFCRTAQNQIETKKLFCAGLRCIRDRMLADWRGSRLHPPEVSRSVGRGKCTMLALQRGGRDLRPVPRSMADRAWLSFSRLSPRVSIWGPVEADLCGVAWPSFNLSQMAVLCRHHTRESQGSSV